MIVPSSNQNSESFVRDIGGLTDPFETPRASDCSFLVDEGDISFCGARSSTAMVVGKGKKLQSAKRFESRFIGLHVLRVSLLPASVGQVASHVIIYRR